MLSNCVTTLNLEEKKLNRLKRRMNEHTRLHGQMLIFHLCFYKYTYYIRGHTYTNILSLKIQFQPYGNVEKLLVLPPKKLFDTLEKAKAIYNIYNIYIIVRKINYNLSILRFVYRRIFSF